MIQGVVTAEREAVVHLPLLDFQGQQQSVKVVVDTGYTGWLTLPPSLIANLGLSFNRFGRATLADGSEIAFSIYDANLFWDGQVIQIRRTGVRSAYLPEHSVRVTEIRKTESDHEWG